MARGRAVRAADIVIIFVSVLAAAVSALYASSRAAGAPELLVRTEKGEFVYPLDKDARVEARGPLGVTVILISGGQARIAESPCDNQLCVSMGAVSKKGQWASCLPNRVFIEVSGGGGKEGVDAGAY